ncbi:bacterial transcriptional activator domain-containing protein (plasmid) [Streptomyces canus]|uniref:AfsR/SARP family transcriptional regulator n=1 Tax=Streptomyces canus TaxID=58343 RepID=UPI00386E73BA|nr:bacterial transcriptional activator domain-containing protein [Streptomyces canus]
MGFFEFGCTGRVPLPLGAQRLLALLALQNDGIHRATAAEQLWPDGTSCRAAANLRSALCQARRVGSVTVIESVGQRLRLSESVRVDLHRTAESARQVIAAQSPLPAGCDPLLEDLSKELLPGWSEDWLMLERERWNQLRVHALEKLAQQFQRDGQYLSALQTALAAIAIDPFRETAHRTLIEVHVAEGNFANALKCYQDYQAFLQQELDITPSPQMTQLVQELMSA